MPNGWGKNWVRLCAAIDGFRARYGAWPTRVRMFPATLEHLRNDLLDPRSFAQLESKIELVGDEAPMVAEDDEGRSYSYGAEGFSEARPDVSAQEWLGVRPGRRAH